MFAEPDGKLRSVAPQASNDIYLAVPHPSSDPVMEGNKRRVIEFLRTTFFDNAPALECQLAAMCLTLRGINIVRAFMTLGPGGVGQSLNTALIANVYGDMHGFRRHERVLHERRAEEAGRHVHRQGANMT